MKKFYSFLFAAVALVGFAACNSDSTEEPAPAQENVGKMEFTANIGEDTKTALDGLNVTWCEGDQIGIWDGTAIRTFIATETNGNRAKFTGMADLNQKTYYAVYPYCNCAEKGKNHNHHTFDTVKKTWVFDFNNDQPATANSFADDVNISTAVSEGTHLTFVNQLAVLKFQVPEECKFVEFFKDAGMKNLVVKAWGTTEKMMQPKTDYYVTLPADKYDMYARIDACKSGKKSINVEAGKIYDLGTLREKQTSTVYLKVNSDWKSYGARFAVNYFKGVSNYWADMTAVEGKTDVYSAKVSADANIIFCRMDPSTAANNWDNKWTQTDDLQVITDAIYEITGWESGKWNPTTLYLKPGPWNVDNAWFAAYFFNNSTSKNEWVKMTDSDSDGIYEVEKKDYPNVIFCRMNKGYDILSWDANGKDYVWNQTKDLDTPAEYNQRVYTVTGWGESDGAWGEK